MTADVRTKEKGLDLVVTLAFGFLVVAYFLQVCTPLRLNSDVLLCLSMADRAVDTGTWIAWYERATANHSVALPGYPTVIAGLMRLELGQSWALVMLNLVCLAGGLAAAMRICADWGLSRRERMLVGIATLLSWITIKHATLPLTEMMFFALSMNALMLAQKASRRTQGQAWVAAWCAAAVLAILATCTRIIGVALIPALLVALIFPAGAAWRAIEKLVASKTLVAGVILCGAVVVAATIWLSADTEYGLEFALRHRELGSIPAALVAQGQMRLNELGLAGLNLPATAVPARMLMAVLVVGACIAALLGIGVWQLRRQADPALVFVVSYCGILAAWPFLDPRFVLPALPLGLACILVAWRSFNFGRAGQLIGCGWVCGYAVLGVAALVMTTRVTFSGEQFPESYNHGGQLQESYQAAWGKPHDPAKVMPQALQVLKRHERDGKAK